MDLWYEKKTLVSNFDQKLTFFTADKYITIMKNIRIIS